MTLMIDVSQTETGDPLEFSVTVREGDSETRHSVSMAESTYQKLTAGAVPPEQCIEGAFKFLLERNPRSRSFPVLT